MKITVVTVCYNAEKTIAKTMSSVLSQSYRDIEYIIMDGQSTDNTVTIANTIIDEYYAKSELNTSLADIRVFSELDTGLYNAMNKAIDLATGDYIIFMNSGDEFVDMGAIERAVSAIKGMTKDLTSNAIKYDLPDVVFGNVKRIKKDKTYIESYKGSRPLLKLLLTGNIPSHQSTFVKTQIMQEYRFDESYSITADFDFYVRAYKDKLNIKYIRELIAQVDNIEGVSSEISNIEAMREQDDRSLSIHLPIWYYLIKLPKELYRKWKSC